MHKIGPWGFKHYFWQPVLIKKKTYGIIILPEGEQIQIKFCFYIV